MNNKTARRLRKEANYHPRQPREYHIVNKSRKIKKNGQIKHGTVELIDADPRTLYKELKKEYNENKNS